MIMMMIMMRKEEEATAACATATVAFLEGYGEENKSEISRLKTNASEVR